MKTESEKDDRPRKKKKKKKSDNSLWIWLAVGAGVLLVLLLIGGGLMAWRPWEPAPAKVVQNPPPPPPPQPQQQGGGAVIREPKTFLGGLRAAGNRVDRTNDMRQIMLFHTQYCDTFTSASSRTAEGFLNFMMRDAPHLHEAIKDKYFTVNVKARIGSEDIVVYETEQYTTGFFVFRANSQNGFVSPQELKAGLPQ